MGAMSGPDLGLPPSDADRVRVIDSLKVAAGQLGLDEVERRMSLALEVPTQAELARLAWEAPVLSDAAAAARPYRVSAWRDIGYRAHATAYMLVNALLIGTWALTGHGFFWPFFPIAGWGIGLGMHAFGVRAWQRHRHHRKQTEARRIHKSRQEQLPAGARGDKAAREAVRARAAVMFTDIVDSTRLTAVIGDENWTRVRARHREMLGHCYKSRRGREVSAIGDGFLARFDSAGDAVQCAIDIQRTLDDERRKTGFAPSVRIGINAGDVIDEDGDLLGSVVNVASRVTAAAEPDEILTTEAVAERLDGRFDLVDRGLRELKGLDRSLHILSVDWST